MAINLLDENTINKIAAGEVVDRPSSVVKELVENAIDAHSDAVTVEIHEGGMSLIRVTDNGDGIKSDDVRKAFLRHSTSKIRNAEDLVSISSLGFRGEALSSICAVSQVELITKNKDMLMGIRYKNDGGVEKDFEEVGAPHGTTFLVRNLFYNTPARRKFLKTPATEAGYISSLMENLCMSHPDISFKFINNNNIKIQTAGSGRLKDVIYTVYGREITANLIEISREFDKISISGYIGKPIISKGNRNFENYYINGRYIKSSLISKAVEEAYRPFMMQHKYPFCALHLTIDPGLLDVNVHPSKMELRFSYEQEIYDNIKNAVSEGLSHRELIPEIKLDKPENRINKPDIIESGKADKPHINKNTGSITPSPVNYVNHELKQEPVMPEPFEYNRYEIYKEAKKQETLREYGQMELFENKELLHKENKSSIKIIGQVFDTYWIMEFENNMYIVDQHAAHEKVIYERYMAKYENRTISTQQIIPPVVLSFTLAEQEIYTRNKDYFSQLGYEIEEFGFNEYALRGIPADFSCADPKELFNEILDLLGSDYSKKTPESICSRIAEMSCKAAVKGNNKLNMNEINELLNELMNLDKPYNCPHGRPTFIMLGRHELEKKFKRII